MNPYTKCSFAALLSVMRKILSLFLLLVLPVLLTAQSKSFTLQWDDFTAVQADAPKQRVSAGIQKAEREAVSSDILHFDLEYESVQYRVQWEDSNFSDPGSVRVSGIRYGALTPAERALIEHKEIPEEPEFSLTTTEGRDKLYSVFSISPIVRNGNSYRKILSFTVDYRYAPPRRADPPGIVNSVLATGRWYKFKVEKTGIHKIDRAFLERLGMDVSQIQPRNLKIYSHGGQTLPLLNSRTQHYDLPEIPIQVVGEESGSFDAGDYILFYGISTKGYVADNDSHINPYSDESYYYITADGGPGKRVGTLTEPSGTADHTITTFHDYQFHEKDEENPTRLGRIWYGNRFDVNREQQYQFTFPNITADTMKFVIKAAAASESYTSMSVSVNGSALTPLNFIRLSGSMMISPQSREALLPAAGETVTVDLVYDNAGNPSSVAYLDYISVEAVRELKGVNGQLPFRNKNTRSLSGTGVFQLRDAGQFSQVWDVTDPYTIAALQNTERASVISFKQTMGSVREYIAVNPDDYYVPVQISDRRVANQNLKGTIFNDENGNFRDVDYIIVTAPFLMQPALRLARYHRDLQGLNVKVVTTDKIYEEFSSGKQDVAAIRNFIRYVYYNASEPSRRIKYLGIMGDTSIDFKDRWPGNNNIVPTFQTVKNDSETASFMSDDFFGSLGPNEGTIGGHSFDEDGSRKSDIDKLDIAVGRMVVDNVAMANAAVDKIINYTSENSYGNWRTNFVLISDDPDVREEAILQQSLDDLGDEISDKKPFINVKKIHSDAYQQQTSAGGDRYPDVNDAIVQALDVGAVIMNYFGHGGEDGLAHEAIYTKETAQNLKNKDNLPCFVTVTCEFTKFDLPMRITAGELTYQNPDGGAISMVSTTRAVFINVGIEFNEKLAKYLFGYDMEVPEVPAEALRLAKNEVASLNRRVIFYIGDPAMPLAFPKRDIRITRLNGVPVDQAADTLKALSRVKFEGEVRTPDGAVMTDYNGILEAKVYDKNVSRRTLDNDNNGVFMDFTTLGEVIFNGKASIENGRFEFEFVVPRDIQIPVGTGRVSLYAKREQELEDQTGVNLDIQIGGLDKNAPEDNEGPKIRLYMNDESFVSGGITNDSPILIAKLEDENGINTASGIGHDIVAILDGDEANPFVLNEFYQAEVDDFTKGTVNYKFHNLEEGLHTLTLKAWDVYNNSSTAEIQFIVAGDDKLEISKVLNYPNPFVDYTEFWFNHNRPFEPLEVQVQVFTVAGKVVWTRNEIVNTQGFLSREIVWDGRDDFGDRIGKGVYVYKITVKSTLTNQRAEKYEKLVIL